jgi:2-methylcitrate dehydratase
MDKTTALLVEYAQDFSYAAITSPARDATLRHLVDSIACAVAGYSKEPAQIAVRVARTVSGISPATVFGAGLTSHPAYATFANTIMIRGLDWNDGMLAKGGGHPSDMIAALIATAETLGSSGADLLEAIALSYEVLGALGNGAPATQRGWDQGTFMGAATAAGIGKLRHFTGAQLANAISLSIVPSIPLMVTRRGELSMWKGAATADAVMHALTMTQYAGEGMTGPAEPFEGTAGVFEQVTGPFELSLPAYPGGHYITEISHQKMFPAESHSQALLGLMPTVREWTSVDEIESIDVEAYSVMRVAIGLDPSVWDPKNRETADHSLPYLLSVALVDGDVTVDSFTDERIADPALRPVMAKISVRENEEFTAGYRPPGMEIAGSPKVRITVRTKSGGQLQEIVTYPRGHMNNPMSVADIDAKIDRTCRGVIPDEHRDAVRKAWWTIEEAPDLTEAIATIADFGDR